jgi:serine/threonine protein kinase
MDVYKVVKRIGSGTYGSAYLVVNKRSGQEFVLKKVKIDDAKDEKERQQVRAIEMWICWGA